MTTPKQSAEAAALVPVAEFCTLLEAGIARAALEAEGIAVFTAEAETVSIDWRSTGAIGWFKLRVPAPDAERAIAIIEAAHREESARREAEQFNAGPGPSHAAPRAREDRCLACHEVMPDAESVCPACGWSYV